MPENSFSCICSENVMKLKSSCNETCQATFFPATKISEVAQDSRVHQVKDTERKTMTEGERSGKRSRYIKHVVYEENIHPKLLERETDVILKMCAKEMRKKKM